MRRYDDQVISPVNAGGFSKGDPVDGATITIYHEATLVTATLYSDENLTPLANPVTTDSNGRLGFFIQDGRYDIKVFKSGVVDYTHTSVVITDARSIVEVTLNDETYWGGINWFYDRNAAQFKRRDTAKLAWVMRAKRTDDKIAILRAPSGANPITWTTLFEIDNAGKVTTGGNVDAQVFTGDGTWTKPAGVKAVYVVAIGAGGGGGGGAVGAGASAGGGGAVAARMFRAADLGATVAITVPAGGAGSVGAANGTGGGAALFGTIFSAYGGGGGRAGGANSSGGGGGGTAGQGAIGVSGANSLGGLPAQTAGAVGISGQGGGGVNNAAGQPAEYGGGAGGGGGAAAGGAGGRSLYAAGAGGGGSPNGNNAGNGGASGSWGTGGGGAGATVDDTAGAAGANGDAHTMGAGGGGGRGTGNGGAGGAPGGGGGGSGVSGGNGGAGGRAEVRVYAW